MAKADDASTLGKSSENQLPGSGLKTDKMPGHWLLARLGKRVLRPGGLAMTQALLQNLNITKDDEVVELAPGLGLTANLILEENPGSYIGVERDKTAAAFTSNNLPDATNVQVRKGAADKTGLNDASATIVIGEAMLSMNSPEHKLMIMKEAFRILRPGGHYAIHELLIVPDDVRTNVKQEIEDALSGAIHVGARPLTEKEWREQLEQVGFTVQKISQAPMNLLRPARLFADEGLWPALKFLGNVLKDSHARRRVLTMRRTFHKHRAHLRAISIIAQK